MPGRESDFLRVSKYNVLSDQLMNVRSTIACAGRYLYTLFVSIPKSADIFNKIGLLCPQESMDCIVFLKTYSGTKWVQAAVYHLHTYQVVMMVRQNHMPEAIKTKRSRRE